MGTRLRSGSDNDLLRTQSHENTLFARISSATCEAGSCTPYLCCQRVNGKAFPLYHTSGNLENSVTGQSNVQGRVIPAMWRDCRWKRTQLFAGSEIGSWADERKVVFSMSFIGILRVKGTAQHCKKQSYLANCIKKTGGR